MPEVSVIIPTYNCKEYLSRCLNSWKKQTIKDIEIIVVDDGSSDNSLQFLEKQTGISVISYSDNKGANYARNRGMEKATGRYIFFSDADAYVRPNLLEVSLHILKTKRQYKWIYYNFVTLEDGNRIKYQFPDYDYELLKVENYISFMSLIDRKIMPEKLDESLYRLQDWDLFLTLGKQGFRGYHLKKVFFTAYIRPEGITRQKNTNIIADYEVREKHKLYISKELRERYEELRNNNN